MPLKLAVWNSQIHCHRLPLWRKCAPEVKAAKGLKWCRANVKCFLDDIKVSEPSEEVHATGNDSPMLQMMRKDEAPYRVSSLSWTLFKTESTENPTPHAVYLKMTRGAGWHPKNQNALNRQRKKLNTNVCGKKLKEKKEEKKKKLVAKL